MTTVLLILVSRLCKKIFDQIFFWYGFVSALFKRELIAYLKDCEIIDDVYLNVTGKYILNDLLRISGPEFGNRLRTISCTLGLIVPKRFGSWWISWLSRRQKDHCKLAVESHKQNILTEARMLNLKVDLQDN